jgi:hypothetical protein
MVSRGPNPFACRAGRPLGVDLRRRDPGGCLSPVESESLPGGCHSGGSTNQGGSRPPCDPVLSSKAAPGAGVRRPEADLAQYTDEYRQRVLAAIEQKRAGGTIAARSLPISGGSERLPRINSSYPMTGHGRTSPVATLNSVCQ